MPRDRKSIEQLIDETYEHDEVRRAVLSSVQHHEQIDQGHIDRILRGQLALPSNYDAERFAAGVDKHEDIMRKSINGVVTPSAYDANAHNESKLKLRQIQEGK